jgi:hypothetical protein
MWRPISYIIVLLIGIGIGLAFSINLHPRQSQASSQTEQASESEIIPGPSLVKASLRTRSISTKRLRKNSHDEFTWRWIKDSIEQYPQDLFALTFSESQSYSVTMYRLGSDDTDELRYINEELAKREKPQLKANGMYARIELRVADIVCPDWYGVIDLEEPKLLFFVGRSG